MRFAYTSAMVLCLVAAGPGTALAGDVEDDVAAAYEAWNEAFNQGDAQAIAAAYVDDAKLLPPTHTVASGPAEIEEFFAGLLDAGVTDHDLQIIEAGGDDQIVYSTANWSAKGKDESGEPQEFGGIATHVFERQDDGSLKLKLHTFN